MKPPPPAGSDPHPDGAQRLMRSRLAILDYLHPPEENPSPSDRAHDTRTPSRWSSLRDAARRYWEGHPARLATGLAAPWVSHWGRRHPLALIALALGAGALLVLARPWRLISFTGLLVAALKSPHLASMVMSAASRARSRAPARDPDPR